MTASAFNRPHLLALAASLTCLTTAAQAQSTASSAPTAPVEVVEVIGTTPMGATQPARQVAAPTRRLTDQDMQRSGAADVSELMSRRMASVHVNNLQGNPLQMDVSFRGYTASPLLGTPQGLSVYLDGIRLNQPFGDVVSWDLIPSSALAEIQLFPGSAPVFGLNTQGGALSLLTKDGRSHPGGSVSLKLGSHQRMGANIEAGGLLPSGMDYYANLNVLEDGGWRVNSKSSVVQGFGKLGWQDGASRWTLSTALAQTDLNGNGLQDQRFLARDWASVYTQPDNTAQSSGMLSLGWDHALSAHSRLQAQAYVRQSRTRTLNADINEGSLDQSVYQPSAAERDALTAAGYSGFPTSGATAANTPFPFWRCIANALLQDEPGEKCNGLINTSRTDQTTMGAQAQWHGRQQWGGFSHDSTVGVVLERSRVSFSQDTQLGYLNPDRTVTPVAAWADGERGGNVDGVPLDLRVRLQARTTSAALFASNTTALAEGWHASASARWQQTRISNRDGLVSAPDPSSLDGDHRFNSVQPALGLTWNPSKAFGAYAGWSQSGRAPTAIELGCANPDEPCKLPNAMAGDPPLKAVRTQSWELGARGRLADGQNWRAGLFRADNRDDILFVADDQTGYGYFRNFGRTRRQGVELGWDGRFGPVSLSVNGTWLAATYQSSETLLGEANSSNDVGGGREGSITIQPGNVMPLIPRRMAKASLGWKLGSGLNLEADAVAVSGSYARGNDNNAHQPDGDLYLGSGRSAGYSVFNLGLGWDAKPGLKLFARVNNLFDRRYTTGAQLGRTGFDANGNFVARPRPAVDGEYPLVSTTFYAPGAPRSLEMGVRWDWGQ